MIRLRVIRSGAIIFVDPKDVTYAIRPDKNQPAVAFVDGITEAFEVVEVTDGSQ